MPALEVKNLTKIFENIRAVDNASFKIPEGSIFGLIGRNGAGKTTTIRMLMNIYMPNSGEILFRGRPVDHEFRARVGYLPEERGLYKKMKVLETILYFAELKGKKGKDVTKKAKDYLERFELSDRANSKLEALSKGNQQKVQFISTIIHDPDFIVLDEPFSGLDPINTNLLKDIILEKKREGKVIIFSTHLMDFAERLCDNIAMIDKGKIILNGDLNTIKADFSKNNVKLTYEGDIFFLHNNPIVSNISDFGNSVGISLKSSGQTQELLKLLLENNVKVISFDSANISLNEIFIKLAGSPAKEGLNLA
ncbi:MAG: ATP-binding cassette domain-containing protein [Desulfatiglans sp.]|nr:ATP-binding cassette domain-containing protein [Desulfatiglans sp.]